MELKLVVYCNTATNMIEMFFHSNKTIKETFFQFKKKKINKKKFEK